MCDCQLRSLSMTTPKNLISCTYSIHLPFSSNFKLFEVCLCLDLWKIMKYVLARLMVNL